MTGKAPRLAKGRQAVPVELVPYMEYLRAELRVSKATVAAYVADLAEFLEEAKRQGEEPPERFDRARVEATAAAAFAEVSPRSHARKLSAVKSYYRFLADEGVTEVDPAAMAVAPRFESSPPYALSPEEMGALLAEAARDSSFEGLRLHALLELLYGSGLRITEALSLRAPSVRLRGDDGGGAPFSYVTVFGKRAKERVIPLTPPAERALRDYVALCPFAEDPGYKGFLFPGERGGANGHLTRQYAGKRLKNLAAAAGLPPEAVHPHALRHAFATHLLQRGAPLLALKELLGHADVASTEIYLHTLSEEHEALAVMHPLARAEH